MAEPLPALIDSWELSNRLAGELNAQLKTGQGWDRRHLLTAPMASDDPRSHTDPRAWTFKLSNLNHYNWCFWLVGLALALDIPDDQWQRLVKLIDGAKATIDHPGAVLDGLWEGIQDVPQEIRDGFKESGHSIGEGAAVSFDENIQAQLNAIYGADVSTAQEALLLLRTVSAVGGASAVGKTGGKVTGKVAEAVSKKLDEILNEAAEKALIKSGGIVGADGKPVLDLKQLTNEQKGILGDLFGTDTVKRIIPDGEKLARIPGIGETGIDDLYKVNRTDVDYVVIEYKFVGTDGKTGSSALGNTTDGKQGSESWTLGSGRLEKSVGNQAIADDIKRSVDAGRTETWVVTTRPNGSTEVQVLDSSGKATPVDMSKVLGSGRNLLGAKP